MYDQSTVNSSSPRTDLKRELRHILERHVGRNNPLPKMRLSRMVGRNERQVREKIVELIEDGMPIGSVSDQPAGYFIATSYQEADEGTRSLLARIEHLSHRRRKVLLNVHSYRGTGQQRRLSGL